MDPQWRPRPDISYGRSFQTRDSAVRSFARPALRPPQPQPVAASPQVAPRPVADVVAPVVLAPVTSPIAPQPTPPQPAPGPQAATVTPSKSRRSQKRRLTTAGLAVLALIIVFGGTALALPKLLTPRDPNGILLQALANGFAGKVQSQTFSGSIGTATQLVSFTGNSDKQGHFSVKATTAIAGQAVTVEALSATGKQLYARGSGLAAIESTKAASNDSEQQFMHSILAAYAPVLKTADNVWYEKDIATGPLAPAKQQQIAWLYKQYPLLSVTQVHAADTVQGEPSYHYTVQINGANLRQFLIAAKDAHLDDSALPQDRLSMLNDNIGAIDFSHYSFEVWISKSNRVLDQLAINKNGFAAQYTVTAFNKPFSVSAPAAATPLNSLTAKMAAIDTSGLANNTPIASGDVVGLNALALGLLQ